MNKKGFGLSEMIIIMFTLIICLVIAVVIYVKNFKNVDNVDQNQEKPHITSMETVDELDQYEKSDEEKEENKTEYNELEEKLTNAAKLYIDNNYYLKNNKVIITEEDLIKSKYISELEDPKDKNSTCNGYVIYDGKDEYKPYIKCSKNYETDNYNSDFE